MKKILALALVLLMSASLLSCTKNIDESEAKNLAHKYMGALRSADGDVLFEAAKLKNQNQIKKEDFQRSLSQTLKKLGDFKAGKDEKFEFVDKTYVLSSEDEFTYRMTTSIIELDKSGGLNNAYFMLREPICEDNDIFKEESFILDNDGAKIYGALTIPKDFKSKKVVLMLQGSGPQDMDETIGLAGNKPFRDLAHGLAQKGVATLRLDKRYVNNAPKDYTVDEEVLSDAKLAIEELKKDSRFDEVYVLGHSLGAMIAPRLAREEGLKKVAMLSASTMKFTDIIYNQQLEYLNSGAVGQAAAEFQKKELDKIKKQIDEMTEKTKGNFFSMPASYVYSVNQVSPVEDIKAADFDVFIAHGSKDFQVKKDELDKFEKALSGKDHIKYKLYEGLNHMMMPEDSDKFSMDIYDKPNNVSDDVIKDLAEFFI